MRAYFFGNMYLSSIQQGIQAQHTTGEFFNKYVTDFAPGSVFEKASRTLWDWSRNHKTSILLNGGFGENLHALVDMFSSPHNPFPWAHFHEEQAALDGALTCVGIVLPERIYATASAIRGDQELVDEIMASGAWENEDGDLWRLSKWEFELCQELNKYGLAS